MQETKEICLIPELEHSYKYTISSEGIIVWSCLACGDVQIEFEDFSM